MKILFCVANRREIDEAKMYGKFCNKLEIALRYTGIGVKNLNAIKEEIFTGGYDLVINAGFAGILNNDFQIFDVVLPYRYICASSGEVRELQSFSPVAKKWITGSIVTTARPITSEYERQSLQKRFGADIVDMESYYLADLAWRKGIPFFSIKVLTDMANSTATADCFRNLKRAREILSDTVPAYISAIDEI